jgi:uncharacterized membrane protein
MAIRSSWRSGADVELLVAALPAFLASLVEAVEALTIILAVGVTRQWRSTIYGALAGLAVLTLVVLVFGTAIVLFVPINALRVFIGALLLIYGLQWTCKSILRASGAKAKHDEEAIYAEEVGRLRAEAPVPATGFDGVSATVAFKGVFLEGLEVVFIVITFGTNQHNVGLAAAAAAAAVAVVVLAGVAVHAPLTRVPENVMKFGVGVMLTSFGMFWGAEGAGAKWPGGDAALLVLIPATLLFSVWLVAAVRRKHAAGRPVGEPIGA